MIDAENLTLEELAIALAPALADAAIFDGWGEQALATAAQLEGVDADVARLAFPDGAMDMIAAWTASIDRRMAESLDPVELASMKIRERIRTLVLFRLEAALPQREAVRRAIAVMLLPGNIRRSLRLGWRSADLMWRMAGDRATDYNHYSKRAILASIYAATLSVFVNDDSEGQGETHAFLDRRIDDVMQFEKTKASLLKPGMERFSVTRLLGRLRYPAI
ncbi:COQ9 family protein [Croceicoccus sp. F390]|uniref:COQ9 family protein n=1 Tax=Croceicoccus esteveae TaxID=3075597 RepID=A0ABU2ZEV5_9SPHN|nr:COQ9 family protein [Croceicoccus sp. F390]MDT0575137.1 COQ9 family protein [Croceicoccus sp. F390]